LPSAAAGGFTRCSSSPGRPRFPGRLSGEPIPTGGIGVNSTVPHARGTAPHRRPAMRTAIRVLFTLPALGLMAACGSDGSSSSAGPKATAEEARAFVEELNREFAAIGKEVAAAGWVQSTYITPDTQLL